MSDKQKKRYYWLKLKEDFFEEDTIEWLEDQPNGKEYSLFYLKLCLKSLKTDGLLVRNVGNLMIPYNPESLAKLTRTEIDTVKVAMDLFNKIGLIQMLESGEIFLSQLGELVGSETEYAVQKRMQRAKKDNVHKLSGKGRLEIEQEQELDLEKEQQQEQQQKQEQDLELDLDLDHADAPAAPSISNDTSTELMSTVNDLDSCIEYYTFEFDDIGSIERETLNRLGKKYSFDFLYEAIIKAVHADDVQSPLAYITSILKDWDKKGFTDLEDIRNEQEEFNDQEDQSDKKRWFIDSDELPF